MQLDFVESDNGFRPFYMVTKFINREEFNIWCSFFDTVVDDGLPAVCPRSCLIQAKRKFREQWERVEYEMNAGKRGDDAIKSLS